MSDNKEKIRERIRKKLDGITVIEPEPLPDLNEDDKPIRVAAYCRVSTGNEEQTSSFEIQKTYYEELIARHKNWVPAGIYADEGISGTSLAHREEFNRMVDDAIDGKMDMIIVKQTSRFSRNVHDILSVVRKLKFLNPPVRVFFEGENIDSLKSEHEMILEMMGMVAEAESRSKSNAMNWSYDRRCERGNFLTPDLFGYRVNEEKEYIIQEDEAEVIRLVYSMYVTGYSKKEIAETMASLGMISNMDGEVHWNSNVVDNILFNERRCGMIIARKTYTPNFFDHKAKPNDGLPGQRKKYSMDEHHEAIVSPEMYKYALTLKRLYKMSHFYGEIPSLSVITKGALKGFVPVCKNYPGFTYENYLVASNFAYDLDSKGNRKNKTDLLTKADISEFDLMGYQKVDGQLLFTLKNPILWFKYNEMFFNCACLGKMGESEYIELLFEPYEGLLAIRSCDKDHPNAIKWARDKKGKLRTVNLSCNGFASLLFDALGWDPSRRYKMIGVKREKAGESVVLFSLEDAEPMTMEKVVYDDGTELIAYTLYNDYFLNQFGKDIYEDAYSNRLYLMDIFQKWNLKADVVPVEDEKEWMKNARAMVAKYIEKLKSAEVN